ncbi:MAG: biotin transporter BioY [Nitrososphaerota archaeon]|nr:biotin transporter BioY [Nitrososphaerota archaeon]
MKIISDGLVCILDSPSADAPITSQRGTSKFWHYNRTRGLALSAIFATILSIASLVSVPLPFTPIPITLQVMVVFLIVAMLGPVYGTYSCLLYLFLGVAGLPVFAGATSGIAVMLGPAGGYLLGFPVGTLIGGLLARSLAESRKADAVRVSAAIFSTLLIIYLVGFLWLAVYSKLTPFQAFLIGVVPFIGIDVLKAIVAIPIALSLRRSGLRLPLRPRSDRHMVYGQQG